MTGVNKFSLFFKHRIWNVKRGEVSSFTFFIYEIIRKLMLTIGFFTSRRVMSSASALTYSTLLAFVPILSVVFAIARGFGYNKYIEIWFRHSFENQAQVAETIIGFVNSYLEHTKSGIIFGIGLVFMIYTVLMLTNNIEQTFNDIWQVKRTRSLLRSITDYLSIFFLMPIVIVVSSGMSIFVVALGKSMQETVLIGPMMNAGIKMIPFVVMSLVFIALYVYMPNTKVKIRSVIVPGILAGTAMQGLQMLYINSQLWVSGYNAIYGSFAALPLFMLWIQLTWTICLFGAQLSYTNQNMEDLFVTTDFAHISHRYRILTCSLVMSFICKQFNKGEKPLSATMIKELTGIPMRLTNEILFILQQINMVVEVVNDEKREDARYLPAESLDRLTVGALIDRLESNGKWNITIDSNFLHSHSFSKILSSRNSYLASMREIKLKDV